MRLGRIEIRHLPGIADGFSLEPAAPVVLVLGPNGSGKTSLVRAVHSLLWPDAPGSGEHLLTASFADGDVAYVVTRGVDGRVRWTRDGRECPAPPLPRDHLAAGYRLGLLDLSTTTGSTDDQAFADEIRRQMAGGFDLDVTGPDLFNPQRGALTRRSSEWRRARDRAETLKLQHRDLRNRERRLKDLRGDLNEARRAHGRLEALRIARDHAAAAAALDEAELALRRFPAAMAAWRDDDPKTIQDLLARRDDAKRSVAGAEAELARMREERRRLDLPEGVRWGAVCVELEEAAAAWRDADSEARNAKDIGAEAARRRAADLAALAMDPASVARGMPERPAVEKLARLFADATEARCRQEVVQGLLREPGLDETGARDPAAVAACAAVLRRWLDAGPAPSWNAALVAGLAGAAVLVLALVVITGSDPARAPFLIAGTATLLVGLGLGVRTWRARRRLDTLSAVAWSAAAELEDAPFSPGDREAGRSWQLRLETGAARDELTDRWRRRLKADLDAATARREEVGRRGTELQSTHGLGRDLDAAGLLHDVGALHRLHESDLALHRAVAEAEAGRAAAGKRRDRFATLARPIAAEPPVDVAAATALVRDLRMRVADDARLAENIAEASARRDRADEAVRQADAELVRFRRRLHLDPDASGPAEVAALAERQDAWNQAREFREQRLAAHAVLSGRLDPELAALDPAELAERIAAAENAQQEAERLQTEVISLEKDRDLARTDRALEFALVEEERRRDLVVEIHDAARRAALANGFLEDLRLHNDRTARPEVLVRATDLFSRFTHGRYRLLIDGDVGSGSRFRARDTATKRTLDLPELSDGTRAQLLLAVRLAFIVGIEDGLRPPLFLDEALTTSDRARFAAIAGSLGEIARDQGRQIYYLTSDPSDAAAWRDVLVGRDLPPPQIIDLARVRALAGAATEESLVAPPLPLPPSPREHDAAGYAAALGVPGLKPWREPSAQHLYWVTGQDRDLLHRLATVEQRTVGQWIEARPHLEQAGRFTQAESAWLERRIAVLDAFLVHWRVGRGRPVSPGIIAEADLSPSMRDRVLAVLEKYGWSAAHLVAAFERGEVERLQKRIAERLFEHLRAEGCLDGRTILTREVLLVRVLGDIPAATASTEYARPDDVETRELIHGLWHAAERAAEAGSPRC